ncbi:unnamed protein product [Rotaria sp. Silwood2]|nr:unnamed protein product [Rotaria sp. Silwood2]CAF4273813.1 unnamed protein product [Rotaria sp. Silwood2]
MDESMKTIMMNEFLEKLNGAKNNEILLDKLEREQKIKFLNAQDNYQKAVKDSKQSTATNVNLVNITILEDIMKFHEKLTSMVTRVIQEYEDNKYKTEEKIQSHLNFINYPRSQNLMEFDPLVLDCTCEGRDDHDDIQLIWFQNNKQIHQNADIRHEREGNIFKLFVTAVFPDDSGVFSALLKSKSTNDEQLSSCSIIIQPRNKEALDPGFIQFPQSIRSMKDSKAIFNCKTSGSTPMTAQWNLNGEQLNLESNRFILTNDEREFSLEIPVVLPTDEGQYTVIISNDKGQSTAAFTLHVDQS